MQHPKRSPGRAVLDCCGLRYSVRNLSRLSWNVTSSPAKYRPICSGSFATIWSSVRFAASSTAIAIFRLSTSIPTYATLFPLLFAPPDLCVVRRYPSNPRVLNQEAFHIVYRHHL